MSRIRVLVADDSLTVRKLLCAALEADPECEVIGEAADGRRAFELCAALRPSVVTLDMMMPGLDGLAATEQIMAFCPTPILIVAASLQGGAARKTFKALSAGAVEIFPKPTDEASAALFDRRFVATVKLVSRIKVITHLRGRFPAEPARGAPQVEARGSAFVGARQVSPGSAFAGPGRAPSAGRYRLVVVGASTGGPGALAAVLGALPATFPLPVLLLLHISSTFGPSFVDWIGTQLALPVAFAVDREPLPLPGLPRVIVAPPDRHLVIRAGRLWLTAEPERHSCRPSVDVLFESAASEVGPSAIGCLLTGMGRDGAKGLLAMKRAGAMTLAQDEATSVVFGMPREAVRLGAARLVLPLGAIGPALWSFAQRGAGA